MERRAGARAIPDSTSSAQLSTGENSARTARPPNSAYAITWINRGRLEVPSGTCRRHRATDRESGQAPEQAERRRRLAPDPLSPLCGSGLDLVHEIWRPRQVRGADHGGARSGNARLQLPAHHRGSQRREQEQPVVVGVERQNSGAAVKRRTTRHMTLY